MTEFPRLDLSDIPNVERLLCPEEIADLHGGYWGEHPRYPLHLWKIAVRTEDTRLGYWSWVRSQIDEEDSPDA